MRGLSGRTVAVLGGAGGIGAAAAARLAEEGATVVVGDVDLTGARRTVETITAAGGEDTRPAYAASKAGVNALTRHVASRWGKEGVRCNGVAPGMVLSATALATMDEEFRNRGLAGARSSRLGRPEDLAAACAFLLSDDAAWVNGQVWAVDGGASLRD